MFWVLCCNVLWYTWAIYLVLLAYLNDIAICTVSRLSEQACFHYLALAGTFPFRVNFSFLRMGRLVLLLCLATFVAAQIPEGCVDCGVPQHPNCQVSWKQTHLIWFVFKTLFSIWDQNIPKCFKFGDCTTTCGWCRAAPPQLEAGAGDMVVMVVLI